MLLNGKTALVTGGGRGIGFAIAAAFAKEGAGIIIADREIEPSALEELRSHGTVVEARQVDVTDEAAVKRMFAEIESLDILVNNVGTYGPVEKIADMDTEAWNRTFAINMTSTMMCSREALRIMAPRKSGNIINIASNVARRGLPYRGCYVATKWAMLGLTQTLALENAEHNIRVNAILPGPVPTPHLDEVMEIHAKVEGKDVKDVAEDWRLCAPMKRFIEPNEVGNVAVFLASDQSSAMTGQSLNVTCGFLMT